MVVPDRWHNPFRIGFEIAIFAAAAHDICGTFRAQKSTMRRRALLTLLCLVAACGGKSVEVEQEANGGSSGAAGSANNTGGALDDSATCPAQPPVYGSPCHYNGEHSCVYQIDSCTSRSFDCGGGYWAEEVPSDGAAYTCSNFRDGDLGVPKDGASCACLGNLDCTINECDSVGQVHATCDNTSWHVTTTPCANTPCGPNGLSCTPDELCETPSGLGDQYNCRANPCAEVNQTTSCACASSLCSSFEVCSTRDNQLFCDCPTCG